MSLKDLFKKKQHPVHSDEQQQIDAGLVSVPTVTLPDPNAGIGPGFWLGDVWVRADAHGRYRLNDVHKASGGAVKNRPSDWLKNAKTQDLVQQIESESAGDENSSLEQNQALKVINGGDPSTIGVYACKELVVAYAAWISVEFHLKVLRVFIASEETASGHRPMPPGFDLSAITVFDMARWLLDTEKELLAARGEIEVLTVQLGEALPKAKLIDRVVEENESTLGFMECSKILNVLTKEMTDWMYHQKWITKYSKDGPWFALKAGLEGGYVIQGLRTFTPKNGKTATVKGSVKITSRGFVLLAEEFGYKGENPLPPVTVHKKGKVTIVQLTAPDKMQ